jgi:hypothetical protein
LSHDGRKLAVKDVDHRFDAGAAERRQSPRLRATQSDGGCAERQCLENICTSADAAD